MDISLEKAIEILTLMGTPDFQGHTEDIKAARKLGTEALLAVKGYRLTKDDSLLLLLPGETPGD